MKCDFDNNGENRYFLVAVDANCSKVIETIEYGSASELINGCTNSALKDLPEIGTVFVHPNYQRRGIGNLLLNAMFLILLSRALKNSV